MPGIKKKKKKKRSGKALQPSSEPAEGGKREICQDAFSKLGGKKKEKGELTRNDSAQQRSRKEKGKKRPADRVRPSG